MALADIFAGLENHAQAIQAVVVVISAAGALATFIWKTISEARDRERQLYNELYVTSRHVHKVILEHSHLDVSWFRDAPGKPLSEEDAHKQDMIFDMLTRLFEHAFLIFETASGAQRQRQWAGWDDYIGEYCRKRSYWRWWDRTEWPLKTYRPEGDHGYDKSFGRYLEGKFAAAAPAKA